MMWHGRPNRLWSSTWNPSLPEQLCMHLDLLSNRNKYGELNHQGWHNCVRRVVDSEPHKRLL